MPRWMDLRRDGLRQTAQPHLAFCVGIIRGNNAAVAVNQSHFPLSEMIEAGLRQRKFLRPNNGLEEHSAGMHCPALDADGLGCPVAVGRSSRGCIAKLNPANRLFLSKSLHYFPRA